MGEEYDTVNTDVHKLSSIWACNGSSTYIWINRLTVTSTLPFSQKLMRMG